MSVRNLTKNVDLEGNLAAESSGVQTVLSGDLTGTINAGDALELTFLSPNYANQAGTLDYIASHCDYAKDTIHVASVTWGDIQFEESIASFNNKQAIVKFILKNEAKTANLSASKLEVEVDGTTYTITPASESSEIFVALPGFTDQTIKLTATVGSEKYTFTSPTTKTFENGMYYVITVGMAEKPHAFSISPTKQIEFAHGNLQYKKDINTWRIARKQYDYVGNWFTVHMYPDNNDDPYLANKPWAEPPITGTVYEGGVKCNNTGGGMTGGYTRTDCWVDLFYWNTANKDNPIYITDVSSYFAIDQSSFVDWGTNPIYDPNADITYPANSGWRTLTVDEWDYVISGRNDADHLCGLASLTVPTPDGDQDVKGCILLPDDFVMPDGVTFHYITDPTNPSIMSLGVNQEYKGQHVWPNSPLYKPSDEELEADEDAFLKLIVNTLNHEQYVFNHNRYELTDWEKLEANGAVFLPVAGWIEQRIKWGELYPMHEFASFIGGYWTSSYEGGEDASYFMMNFQEPQIGGVNSTSQPFCRGLSVRLVRDL